MIRNMFTLPHGSLFLTFSQRLKMCHLKYIEEHSLEKEDLTSWHQKVEQCVFQKEIYTLCRISQTHMNESCMFFIKEPHHKKIHKKSTLHNTGPLNRQQCGDNVFCVELLNRKHSLSKEKRKGKKTTKQIQVLFLEWVKHYSHSHYYQRTSKVKIPPSTVARTPLLNFTDMY